MWTGLGLNVCVQSLTKGPPGLRARSQRATFAGSVDVIVKAVLQASAQPATVNDLGQVGGGTLDAVSQASTFAGVLAAQVSGVLAASSQAATFDGDGQAQAVPDALAFWDPAINVTLGATLLASGTTPPAVTLTGTLAFATGCPAIWVDIKPGAATFDVSYDNGVNIAHADVNIPLGSTYALDGAASGVTLNFPNSTYNADNLYQATVQTWTSTDGNTVATNATAAQQPIYRSAAWMAANIAGWPAGMPALDCDGTDDRLPITTGAAALITAITHLPAFTLGYRAKFDVADSTLRVFGYGLSSHATSGSASWGTSSTGAGKWVAQCISNAAANIAVDSTANDDTSPHAFIWFHDGALVSLRVDLAAADPNDASQNTANLVPDQVALFCRPSSTAANFMNGPVGCVGFWNSELTSDQQTALNDDLLS